MGTAWTDLCHGARLLRRTPGFTAIAALTLALGIGANTAIFSLVNAVVLRPLPVKNPGELVFLYTSDFSGPVYSASSYPDFEDIRKSTAATLSGLLAYTLTPVNLRTGDRTERVIAELGSEEYFEVLGVEASLGRVFSRAEARAGAAQRVVVLSHGYWRRRFGADPAIAGRSVTINGQPFTVLGVAPPKFSGNTRLIDVDVWVPLAAMRSDLNSRGNRGLFLVGRLRPGRTAEQLQAQMIALAAQLHQAYPENWTDLQKQSRKLTVVPEGESRVPMRERASILGFLALLLIVVGVVLLIACANIASLLLARAATRQREIGIRLALGAGRTRLIRQLITENLLLCLLGGAAGLLIAVWLNAALMAFKPPLPITLALDLTLDYRVLAFATIVSFFTGLLFGLAPALQATRTDILASLKESTPTCVTLRRFGMRNIMVAGQVAASFVLLVAAGLFVRSLQHAYDMDPGFRTGNMLLMSIELEEQAYSKEKGQRFQAEFLEKVRALPGVESAEFAQRTALGLEAAQRRNFDIEGYTARQGEDMELYFNVVGPRYFETMGLPIVRGRSYTEQDREGAPGVVVVNETFARRYWPGQDPIGKRMGSGALDRQVVGVAKDAKYISLGEEPIPFVYLPLRQMYESQVTLHVRTHGDPGALIKPVQSEAEAIDRELPISGIKNFSEHLGISLLPARMAAVMLSAFGFLALLLAATGLYGVIAFDVTQRTREIGIRVAIGAQRRDVLRMVVTQGMALALAGIAVGLAGAFALTRLLGSMLLGVSPTDLVTFGVVSLVLGAAALAASIGPALRATKVDPMVALRYE